jgi:ABC-2 type transport system permease protein
MSAPSIPGPGRAAWLVARRELRLRLTGLPFALGTAAVLLALVGYLLIQGLAVQPDRITQVGLSGQAIVLAGPLQQDTAQLGLPIDTYPVTDVAVGQRQVADGQLDVLVSGAPGALRVVVRDRLDGRLRGALTSLMQQQALDAQLAEAGLKPADVQGAIAKIAPRISALAPNDPNQPERGGIGLVAAVLMYLVLVLTGAALARGVAAQRADGGLEVLLSTVSPPVWLAGQAAGLALTGLVQLLVVGLLGIAVAGGLGVLGLVGAAFGALGVAALWYLLGFVLYAAAWVAGAARAGRRRELRQALTPVLVVLGVGFAVGIGLLAGDPAGGAAATLSVLPPFAPVLMAGRMAMGLAPAWQVLLAVLLTLAGGAALSRYGVRELSRD